MVGDCQITEGSSAAERAESREFLGAGSSGGLQSHPIRHLTVIVNRGALHRKDLGMVWHRVEHFS